MKSLLLILFLLPINGLTCSNSIPMSEVVKAINLEPNAGSKSCKDLPLDECVCFDGIQWESAELIDNEVLDYVKKENVISCELLGNTEELPDFNPYQDCDDKFASLVCEQGIAINNYEQLEVYCAVNVMKIDGKKLVESPSKKAAYLAQKEAEKQAEEAKTLVKKQACEALNNVSDTQLNQATTIAALRSIVKLIKDCK